MNIIQKIVKQLTRDKDEKSFTAPTVFELTGKYSRLPSPSGRNYAPYVEAYADKPWIYSTVSVIAETVSSTEFLLKNAKGEIITKHPVLELMYKPNPLMTGRQLRQWITASLELTGNAYILKDSLRSDGSPVELFPLLSHLVEVVPGTMAAEPVQGYKYRVGSKTAYYRAKDIIHIKYFNPFDFFYGLSPLAAARGAADAIESAENYNRAFFDNSATISGILSTENKLDDATRTRISKAWNDKYTSAAKAHKVALLEGGLKWQSIGMSQKDMDFISGVKINRETILSVFHVPPALVGIFDHAPQFNTREQQRIFYQTCVLPKLTLILESLTEFLLPDFDSSRELYLTPDISAVSVLKDDEVQRAQAAKLYLDMGFGRDEVINALGLPFSVSTVKKAKRKF
ncbi:Phage portal protein, HK97 family [Elusimicrobium minutum Pei191]|uniref:Phage portal protein, HK97 family n=1 Tax=Elusimicrobium minutum (strain Pei191) TaxID=445932 RepID=B2KCK6_ELUMP|nr:phage portal protein [Elusimicrobium minutum]ACC98252.1 Phage portal protein, HK97 family [Elusimicrobium minutum Pei191]